MRETADVDAVRTTVERYLAAVADADYSTACQQLTARVRADLSAFAVQQLGLPADDGCVAALERIMDVAERPAVAQALRQARVTAVHVDGDTATATIAGATTPPRLRREQGAWLISRLEM